MNFKSYYTVSDELISREIEGEIIIVPLNQGIGSLDESLFTLNKTGKIIWDMLDGSKSIEQLIDYLVEKFNASKETIQLDVVEIITNLLDKGLVIKSEK